MLVSPMQGGWDILSTQIVDPHLAVDAVIAVCGHCSYLVAGVYILHVHTLHNAVRCAWASHNGCSTVSISGNLQEHPVLKVLQIKTVQAMQDELRI